MGLAVLTAFALLMFLWPAAQLRSGIMLIRAAVPVAATMRYVESRPSNASASGRSYDLEYRYQFGGQDFTGSRVLPVDGDTFEMTERVHAEFPAGSQFVAWVLPDDPEFAFVYQEIPAPLFVFPSLAVSFWTVVAALLSGVVLRQWRLPECLSIRAAYIRLHVLASSSLIAGSGAVSVLLLVIPVALYAQAYSGTATAVGCAVIGFASFALLIIIGIDGAARRRIADGLLLYFAPNKSDTRAYTCALVCSANEPPSYVTSELHVRLRSTNTGTNAWLLLADDKWDLDGEWTRVNAEKGDGERLNDDHGAPGDQPKTEVMFRIPEEWSDSEGRVSSGVEVFRSIECVLTICRHRYPRRVQASCLVPPSLVTR